MRRSCCGWVHGVVSVLVICASNLVVDVPARADENNTPVSSPGIARLTARLTTAIAGKAGCSDRCNISSPLVIEGGSGRVVRDIRIDGAEGDCVTIRGGANEIILENIELANCGRDGIKISGARAVLIRNVTVRNTRGNAVTIENGSDVTVSESRFEDVATGVYALSSSGIVIRKSFFRNVQGPMPRGQGIQFDKVVGPGNAVMCNLVINEPGRSNPEDAINIFRSRGTEASPILIAGNRIAGGGPSPSGGGILVGDYGGTNIRVFQNRLVDPGQYGIAIAGGSHMELTGNKVFARRQPFTNVGLYVWKADGGQERCHAHRVNLNEVKYTNAAGAANPAWNAENCGPVEGFETLNRWNAALDQSILLEPLSVCERR